MSESRYLIRAGITDSPWKIADIVRLVEERQNAIDSDLDGEWKMGAEAFR